MKKLKIGKIGKKCIPFLKALEKTKKEPAVLLSKITNLKQDTDNEDKFDEYNKNKNDLKIYICYPLLSNVIHCRRCENSQQKLLVFIQ